MGPVKKLVDEVERGLASLLPRVRKTVISKLALTVGAMIAGQMPNTAEFADLLPLKTERQDMREQWLRRLLKSPFGGDGANTSLRDRRAGRDVFLQTTRCAHALRYKLSASNFKG